MVDRIDARPRRVLDPARPVGMGGDLQPEPVRGAGDVADFCRVEMALEPALLLAEDPAGRGDLDQVGSALGPFADALGALVGAGAGAARIERGVDLRPEAADVAVPADDRQRAARS